MATLHTEALVLRAVDFGESDRIVHLLTPAAGRLPAIAKGARRSKRRFPGTLDLMNRLAVQIERRRPAALARLEGARLLHTYEAVRTDPVRFALGCYLLELLDRLAPEGGGARDLGRLFRFALDALELLISRSLARDFSSSRRAPPIAASQPYLSSACFRASVFMMSV